jgi:hypothetical protein
MNLFQTRLLLRGSGKISIKNGGFFWGGFEDYMLKFFSSQFFAKILYDVKDIHNCSLNVIHEPTLHHYILELKYCSQLTS